MFYECWKLVLNITFLLDFSLPIQCTFLRMICLFCNIIPRIEVIRLNKSFFFIQICDTFVDIEVTLRTDVYVKVDICEIENSRASSAKMSKGEVWLSSTKNMSMIHIHIKDFFQFSFQIFRISGLLWLFEVFNGFCILRSCGLLCLSMVIVLLWFLLWPFLDFYVI